VRHFINEIPRILFHLVFVRVQSWLPFIQLKNLIKPIGFAVFPRIATKINQNLESLETPAWMDAPTYCTYCNLKIEKIVSRL
jgi:hypothetical protein